MLSILSISISFLSCCCCCSTSFLPLLCLLTLSFVCDDFVGDAVMSGSDDFVVLFLVDSERRGLEDSAEEIELDDSEER